MTKRADPKRKQSIWTTIPNYVRSIMLFQFFLILMMGGWLYLEYTHNVYLQSYVKNYLQASPAILQLGIPGVLAGISGALYAKLRRTRQELEVVEAEITSEPLAYDTLPGLLSSLPQLESGLPAETSHTGFQSRRYHRRSGQLSRISDGRKIPYQD